MIKKNTNFTYSFGYVRSILFFLPILFINIGYYFEPQYNPYSSVIEKSVVEDRENRYKELGSDLYYYPKPNEY